MSLKDIIKEGISTISSLYSEGEAREMVLAYLKKSDIVSYIRFASVYREFKDIDSFMAEIKSLSSKRKRVSPKKENDND